MQEPQDRRGLAVIADRESSKGEEPRNRPLHHPAIVSETLARFNAATGDPRCDATSAERAAVTRVIVRLVTVEFPWAKAGPSRLADGTTDWWDGVDQWL
jgi:hypothetical protein